MAQREGCRPASDAPQSAARFVRRGAPAIRARHVREGNPIRQFRAECLALVDWATRADLIIELNYVEQFKYFGSGAEHRVYHNASANLAVKATVAGRFGHSVYAPGAQATPFEYLSRLGWHNLIFGDDIHIVGVSFDGEQHIEVVHSQPWIYPHEIRPAPFPEEIDAYFAEFGFVRSKSNPTVPLFYSERFDLVVADAHEANVIRDRKGDMAAIDIVIGHPGASVLAEILRPTD